MKHYTRILFDLDGTLTDPGVGITNSIIYALKKYGISVDDPSGLYGFIGPPLLDSFRKYFGFSDEESVRAVGYYREYYRDKGIFENYVYDGVEQTLSALKDGGSNLYVATSKPEIFARRIIEHYGHARYFSFVGGGMPNGARTKKSEVISYVLQSAGIGNPEDAVMVGDRSYDIAGAKTVGLSSIGVLYGYGSREELENAGADAIAERPGDIIKLIL